MSSYERESGVWKVGEGILGEEKQKPMSIYQLLYVLARYNEVIKNLLKVMIESGYHKTKEHEWTKINQINFIALSFYILMDTHSYLNIMTYNLSFNSALPALTESDYLYANGKLNIRPHGSNGTYFLIQTFTWKRYAQEFEIKGIELYPFLSSNQVYFSFHKIQ